MKAEEFCELLGEANETYVSQARSVHKRTKRKIWIPWVAAAACLCLVIGTILHPTTSNGPVAEAPNPVPCIAPEPITPWKDWEIYRQYFYLIWDEVQYDSYAVPLSAEVVGAKLAQAEAHGTEYVSAGVEIQHTKPVSVYELKDISSACAVAVQFEGVDTFYLYTSIWYRPETLGQFITDLNLTEHLTFGAIGCSGDRSSFRFEGLDPAVIWDLLLSETEATECFDDFELHLRPKDIMGISINYPLFDIHNVSLAVCEDGYIKSNLLGRGKLFFIGEDRTEAFMDYVWDNCIVQEFPYDSGDSVSDPSPVPSVFIQNGASSPSYQP